MGTSHVDGIQSGGISSAEDCAVCVGTNEKVGAGDEGILRSDRARCQSRMSSLAPTTVLELSYERISVSRSVNHLKSEASAKRLPRRR
jgi:hypothetical protein